MFADREVAKQMLEAALTASGHLDRSLLAIKDVCSPEELHLAKRAVGECMGEMLLELINPILKQYPDLTPSGMKTP